MKGWFVLEYLFFLTGMFGLALLSATSATVISVPAECVPNISSRVLAASFTSGLGGRGSQVGDELPNVELGHTSQVLHVILHPLKLGKACMSYTHTSTKINYFYKPSLVLV
jgi:hypothetical protein